MRGGVTAITTFMCCILALITVMTIGSYNLQKDELERVIDFTAKQTARQCLVEGIEDTATITEMAEKALDSQIYSKKGTLDLYVLHADKDIVDLGIVFTYKQYNGTDKTISCRSTVVRDWDEGAEENAEIRFISKEYFNKSHTEGGLKDYSVWKNDTKLFDTLTNDESEGVGWTTFSSKTEIKSAN